MTDHRRVYLAASLLLDYPREGFDDTARLLIDELAAETGEPAQALARAARDLLELPVAELQRQYVDTFDLSRKHALYLSYWTDGDTRRRGEVLAAFKKRYRASGFLVNLGGELPDYLPVVLEYAALADYADGQAMLQEYRPSLELLRMALEENGSPYQHVLLGLCGSLPGSSPADRQQVMAMAGYGPPTESVGLDPYDPRLLPLRES